MTTQSSTSVEVSKFTIEVSYNGVTKQLEVQLHETIHTAIEQALNVFNIHDGRHLMAFYRESDGSEVMPETISLQEAHITPETHLVLRPSRVKGGSR
jgi:hypothetical protein